jgi:SAM-dependent methyltransferase
MPDEAYWESLFDVPLVLARLGVDSTLGDVVELGCGYGTFSIPVARAIRGSLHTFDIDPAMVAGTAERAAGLGVICQVRDVMERGFGLTGVDAALLFNILHCDEPVALFRHAADAVRPGGLVLVIHWRYGPTPRGPSLDIRPRPEQIITRAHQTGRMRADGPVIDLPPWHYGLRFRVHRASMDHVPPPTTSKNSEPSSMDQSVRAS